MSQAKIRLIAIDVDATLLAERLGFDMPATAAIGDGLNDVEMIEASAFGIAMDNAQEEVKSVTDWVTSSTTRLVSPQPRKSSHAGD
jgi:phosphoserine phosphatase